MATATTKAIQELQQRLRRKGMILAKMPKGGLIIENPRNGKRFQMDRTSGGMNRVRALPPDGGGAGEKTAPVTFGHDLYGRSGRNVLAQLAQIGLDVRDRQSKKSSGEDRDMQNTEDVRPENGDRALAVAKAVDDILSDITSAGEILHEEVLKRARAERSPVQRIDQKKYLDWTGRIVDVLKEGWDVDESFPEQMARLERELPGSLRRGRKLQRIHVLSDGREVWRVYDDGRVFEEAMPAHGVLAGTQAPADPQEAGKGEALHQCPACGFADHSMQAVTMHITQLRDKSGGAHPDTAYPCALCGAVRCTAFSLQTHMRKEHGKGDLCYVCTEAGETKWFVSTGEYNAHLDKEHSSGRRRRRAEASPARAAGGAPRASRATTPKLTVADPQPPQVQAPEETLEAATAISGKVVDHGALSPPAEDLHRAIAAMVTRYPLLEGENATLRDQVAALKERLSEEVETNGDLQKDLERKDRELQEAKSKLEAINRMLGG